MQLNMRAERDSLHESSVRSHRDNQQRGNVQIVEAIHRPKWVSLLSIPIVRNRLSI